MRQFHVREHRFFDDIVVVRAHADPDVKGIVQVQPKRATGRMQIFISARDGHRDVFAALLDAQAPGRRDTGLNLIGACAFGFAILQRSQTVAVQRGVGVGGIGIETLTDDQASFAMRVAALADEADVRRERYVAGNFFPNEVKRVVGEPHVLAAAADGVTATSGVILD